VSIMNMSLIGIGYSEVEALNNLLKIPIEMYEQKVKDSTVLSYLQDLYYIFRTKSVLSIRAIGD